MRLAESRSTGFLLVPRIGRATLRRAGLDWRGTRCRAPNFGTRQRASLHQYKLIRAQSGARLSSFPPYRARPGRGAGRARKLPLQFPAPCFQHFRRAIQDLPAQIRAAFRPGGNGVSCCSHCIKKVLSRCATVIRQYLALGIARGDDASAFTAREFSADEELVGFLHRQPGRLFGH